MADNVLSGANPNVATDELTIGGALAHVQFLKLLDGTADSTNRAIVTPGGALRVEHQPALLAVTGTAAAGAGVTLTLPAVAGQFHYLTSLRIDLYNTAARTGGATPVVVTTTNLPGTPAFTFPSAGAVGAMDRLAHDLAVPLRSSAAGTATTIVAPATANVIWRLTAFYFTGP